MTTKESCLVAVNSISDYWNGNLQSLNREKMKHQYQSFTRIGRQFQSLERQVYADWTSVSSPPLPKELPYMANYDEYINEYNDECLCRHFLSASIFDRGPRLSFQISEFRVHCLVVTKSLAQDRLITRPIYRVSQHY